MELSNIFELWDRFDNSSASKMEIDMHGVHFSLSKEATAVQTECKPTAVHSEVKAASSTDAVKESDDDLIKITAPLVGTFYAAPSPDADPFVKVGQEVKKGDVIGIIEAMKLMNEVVAKEDGIVETILAEDGKMVEFGQVLVTLK